MIKIEVTDEWEVNTETKGTAKELLGQLTVIMAALMHHAPHIFSKKMIHSCVDTAMELEPDGEEEE